MMDRLAYWLYRSAGALVALLPLRVAFALGSLAGSLGYWLAVPYRRLALRNLEIAFGREMSPRECRRLARRHFSTLGGNLLAGVRIARMSREEIMEVVTIEGMEIAERIIREKKGFLLVISHTGNWELFAQLCPIIFQCPVGTIYQRLGNPYIDAEVRADRARLGLSLFERKEGFAGALRMLRAGGGVGVLVDQHAGDGGVWTPFFGRLASTSSLAAMLALRTGAALLPGAAFTAGPGRWRVVLRPPVPVETREVDLLTARINEDLEAQIRSQPADWFWVHNRWKTPRPKFLLAGYKRGVVVPEGTALQPFRVLVRSTNWLGDTVMSVPAVHAIKKGRPDLHLTILAPAKLADFWRVVPEVDEVIAIAEGEGPLSVAGKLRGRFEAAILFPNSLRAALEVRLAGVPRRTGFPGHRRRWLLNQIPREKKKELHAPRHQQHHCLELARSIGAEPEATLPPSHRTPGARARVGLCPGAEYGPAKRWLPERFREVMSGCDADWVLFGTAKDAPVGAQILEGFTGRAENRIGQTSMAELIAELPACDALLTNDTGTMHLAAWLGVPVIALFGSTEPTLTGPLGSGHRIVRHHVECSPCFLRECPLDFRCMRSIEAPEVLTALREVLAEGAAPIDKSTNH